MTLQNSSSKNPSWLRLFIFCFALGPMLGGPGWQQSLEAALSGQLTVPSVIATAAILGMQNEPPSFEDSQRLVFEALFGIAYDPNEITYFMDDAVLGNGEYTGINQYGDPFDFESLVTTPVDLASIEGINQEALDEALELGFEMVGVTGVMTVGAVRVAITGIAYSKGSASTDFDARLLVLTNEDTDGFLFQPPPAPENDVLLISEPPGTSTPRFYTVYVPCEDPMGIEEVIAAISGEKTCEEICFCDYEDSVTMAGATFRAAVNAAREEFNTIKSEAKELRDSQIRMARMDYEDTKFESGLLLAAALTVCNTGFLWGMASCAIHGSWLGLFTGGLALAACIVIAHAVYAICAGLAIAGYNSLMNAARDLRDSDIALARSEYRNTVNDARRDRDDKVESARDTLNAALTEAERVLSGCLDDCEHGCELIIEVPERVFLR